MVSYRLASSPKKMKSKKDIYKIYTGNIYKYVQKIREIYTCV